MIIYDLEFYAYRFVAGAQVDLQWGDDDSGDWHTVCRHKDAVISFVDHATEILEKFPGHGLFLARGDRRNFRHDLWPDYKANRKDRRRPAGYGEALARMSKAGQQRGWPTGGFKNLEGDDVLGILQEEDDIIVSGDKDMLTLPGKLYRNDELIQVSQWEADLAFYRQVLVGDTSDNYPGCPGVGDKNRVFTGKAWLTSTTEHHLWQAVVDQYAKAGKDVQYALTQARCARILRPGEFDLASGLPHLWEPPVI